MMWIATAAIFTINCHHLFLLVIMKLLLGLLFAVLLEGIRDPRPGHEARLSFAVRDHLLNVHRLAMVLLGL